MSARPRAHPKLLSELVEIVPTRLIKKLDASPRAAEGWSWVDDAAGTSVTSDTGEIVRLPSGAVREIGAVSCSCLLSPRCFHVLACIAVLELDEAESETPAAVESVSTPDDGLDSAEPSPPSSAPVILDEPRRSAARAVFLAAERILATGSVGAGAVVQAELLRSAHEARSLGLPRLHSVATRACRTLRAFREERPDATLAGLTRDLRDVFAVAHALLGPEPRAQDVGVARRSYDTIGHLSLVGIFCEPIVGNGYAGVSTTTCDARGRLYVVRDVVPGDSSRARSAYGLSVRMGDTSLTHKELVRDGLFLESATASPDGRLGSGARVKAVGRGATSVSSPELVALFRVPLSEQLGRAYDSLELADDERRETDDLVFFEATILDVGREGVIVSAHAGPGEPARVLRWVVAHDDPELAFADNLRLLGRARGLPVRAVARVLPDRPGVVAPLMVAPPEAEPLEANAPRLALPEIFGGRACLGLDRLQSAHLSGRASPLSQVPEAPAVLDPLARARRRLERVVVGGARTITPGAAKAMDDERRELLAWSMPRGAALLERFSTAMSNRTDMAHAFLALALYDSVTRRALFRATP